MSVTWKLLRSTIPSESMATTPKIETEKKTNKKEASSSFPLLNSSKRRAVVRAKTTICEVVADVSGPSTRSKASKISLKQMEKGDDKNKSCRQMKMKDIEGNRRKRTKEEKNTLKTALAASFHGYHLMVDVHCLGEQYTEARILDLDPDKELLFVHYMGWNARFNACVPLEKAKAHGSYCGVPTKKYASWDGDIPLFSIGKVVAAQYKVRKLKTQKQRVLSPKVCQAARRASQNASTDCKRRHAMRVDEQKELRVKGAMWIILKNSKVAIKPTAKSQRSENGQNVSVKTASTLSQRTPRCVQVTVETIDEDSERTTENQVGDMVLDITIEGREMSDGGVQEEIGEKREGIKKPSASRTKKRKNRKGGFWRKTEYDTVGESKRKRDTSQGDVEISTRTERSPASKKLPRQAGANTSVASAKTAMLPLHSDCPGSRSGIREKLAAIFRLRVQQKQRMEQMHGCRASFQDSLRSHAVGMVMEASTKTDGSAVRTEETEKCYITVANAEVAAEEYRQRLQQYHYHQHLMLANSLYTSVAGGGDPSVIPLEGGIMKPRIIRERSTAVEEGRRQQAHVQAYYLHLMLTKERNVRALAADQAFLASNAAVWEKQLHETQSKDGISRITSWNDGSFVMNNNILPVDEVAVSNSEAGEISKGDNNTSKTSETRLAAADNNVTRVTSSNATEKTAEDFTFTETSRVKSTLSGKCNPADTLTDNVLYEFAL